ncbi:MAG: peptidylprolyl isomerase [Bacteroidota bacterium]|nr:peptidylprolyl isomerase [Bacteroidota bacterium]
MKKLLLCSLLLLFFSCKHVQYANPHVIIDTKFGEIEIELFAKQAPKTVAGFLANIDSGFYSNASFYRVLNDQNQPSNAPKTELIQGGVWHSKQYGNKVFSFIPHETTKQTGLHHISGTVSMARREPGTASTEFFICIDDEPGLDYGGENIDDRQGYAAFGKVVKGMNVVKMIYHENEDNQYFDPPVDIYSIKKL